MSFNNLVAVCIFLIPFAYSPGPGVMFFAVNTARSGFKKILPAIMGYHLGIITFAFCYGIGFDFIVSRYDFILVILRYLGSLYIFYIAYKIFRSGFGSENKEEPGITFYNGLIVVFLNPKAQIVITLMYTKFNDSGEINPLIYILILTLIFSVNNLISVIIYSIFGNTLRLIGNSSSAKYKDGFFAISLILVAIWMLIS
ncbi:LysE family translocator [Chloroflexi bacterium]|nr:LysE family translocator [Chloroflexota bacterium]